MVFVPGVAAKPTPLGIEPAPITSATIDPVDPVAAATFAMANDAAMIDAPRAHRRRFLNMVPLPSSMSEPTTGAHGLSSASSVRNPVRPRGSYGVASDGTTV